MISLTNSKTTPNFYSVGKSPSDSIHVPSVCVCGGEEYEEDPNCTFVPTKALFSRIAASTLPEAKDVEGRREKKET